MNAYLDGREGSTESRRKWLYDAIRISPGIRFGYLLACAAHPWPDKAGDDTGLFPKLEVARAAYDACIARRAAASTKA